MKKVGSAGKPNLEPSNSQPPAEEANLVHDAKAPSLLANTELEGNKVLTAAENVYGKD